MDKDAKIYVAGHRGMVGSAIMRELAERGYRNVVVRASKELDLRRQAETERFFSEEKPEYVFMAAAVVGGILANIQGQARFLLENLQMSCNVIDSAVKNRVKKLLFLGSSCIYPKESSQPISESSLLTGSLEPTNEGYAIAKISGLKLCEYFNLHNGAGFIGAMPCNLYGYNDNFDLETSHMLPALVRKFHEGKVNKSETVTVWGTGTAYRELLFSRDVAKACVFLMENYSEAQFLNVGSGEDHSISEIAEIVKGIVGFDGKIVYDKTKPDGMRRKLLDSSKIRALGWKPEYTLEAGIKLTYDWYVNKMHGSVSP